MNELLALTSLSKYWSDTVAPNIAPNACILGARLAHEVLDYFAIRHEVVTVNVAVMNQEMYDFAISRPEPEPPDTAWSVMVGREIKAKGTGWNGHIVVTTDEWYLDLAAVQFHRPLKQIDVPGPLLFHRDAADIAVGPDLRMAHFALDRGHYLWAPEHNPGYKGSADWRLNHKHYAGGIIRSLKTLETS